MKQQSSTKPMFQPSQFKSFPRCVNKNEARMVCLNEGCSGYAFFCLQCEDQSCESMHRHEDKANKLVAITFKEFIRRVLKEKKPIEELEAAVSTYRQTLERLRLDINEFVEKQLQNLTEVLDKAKQMPEDLSATIKKLKGQDYVNLVGKEMDHLWKNCGDSQETIQTQQQTAEFIRIKEQELKAISEHFQNLNKMQIDKTEDSPQKQSNPQAAQHQQQVQSRNSQSGLSNVSGKVTQ